MQPHSLQLRVGAIASALAAVLLGMQIVVSFQIGPDLASLNSLSSVLVGNLFVNSAGKLRGLMMLDDAFVIAYLLAFAALAVAVRERRAFAEIGLGAGIIAGCFDFTENALILGLLEQYFANLALNALPLLGSNHLLALNIISQLKWLGAGVAAASFGAAVWDARILNRVVSISFLVFAALDVLGMTISSSALARILWMLVVFSAGAMFLSRQRVATQDKV